MILRKNNLKKIISHYLNEGTFDDARYPFHSKFLKTALKNTLRFYGVDDPDVNYNVLVERCYNDLAEIRNPTMTLFDCKLLVLDHYDHFREESRFARKFGDSEGICQIKPQPVIDALRGGRKLTPIYNKIIEYAKKISKNKADENLINILESYYANGFKKLKNHEGEDIKTSDSLKAQVEVYMEEVSNTLNIFLGIAYMTMPGVGSIKGYIGNISDTRKARHKVFSFFIENITNKSLKLGTLIKVYKRYYDKNSDLISNDPMKVYVDMLRKIEQTQREK